MWDEVTEKFFKKIFRKFSGNLKIFFLRFVNILKF